MNITIQHIDLFPTRIWLFDLSGLSEHYPIWQSALDQLRRENPTAAGRSNRNGWNSDKIIAANPLFASLVKAANQAFIHALLQTDPNVNYSFKLELWANIHDQGGYNMFHVHQNVLLSGCFYLTVPEGAGGIIFRDPRPGVVLSPYSGQGINANKNITITPKPGLLVVFPNWLEHAVADHEGIMPRVSIAMNALPAIKTS